MKNEMFFSPELPAFEQTRTGTEVFVMAGDRRISVYDDYTPYPESSARSWRVRVYERATGREVRGVCMHCGLYPTRERALFEVERFRHRADHLVFFVLPVGFEYDKVGALWQDSEKFGSAPASPAELQEEARRRFRIMTGRKLLPETDLAEKVCRRDPQLIRQFTSQDITRRLGLMPFAIAFPDTVIYVSADKSSWGYERSLIACGYESYDGIVPAWVSNIRGANRVSEFGEIAYKCVRGVLYRVA